MTLTVSSLGIRVRDNPAKVAWAARYSLARLAVLCGLKPRTLRRRWKKEFGCTPKRWLMRERLRQAVILVESAKRTCDIAARLGYRDASHFAHDFRRCFGMRTYYWREDFLSNEHRASMMRRIFCPARFHRNDLRN